MARPRLPTAVHYLRGTEQVNPERMRARDNEPQPVGGVGECPSFLAPELAQAWDYIVANAAPGVLTSMDKIILSQAAALLTAFWQKPLTFHPALHARLQSVLGSMGMTPADRSKIVVPRNPATANPFAKFRSA